MASVTSEQQLIAGSSPNARLTRCRRRFHLFVCGARSRNTNLTFALLRSEPPSAAAAAAGLAAVA
jgi:hypothetical protein